MVINQKKRRGERTRNGKKINIVQFFSLIFFLKIGANFIVRFIEEFMHGSHLCLLFELLSTSLLDLVNLSIEANPGTKRKRKERENRKDEEEKQKKKTKQKQKEREKPKKNKRKKQNKKKSKKI